jgi:hypothetical protein
MKQIPLNKNKFAIVDDDDFERLNQFHWFAWKRPNQEKWYAVRSADIKLMTSTDRKMERHIMTAPEGFLIDHKNGDGLDNRKENLRIATYQQNSQNAKKHKITSSKYKGVSRFRNGWVAKITHNGERIHIGVYSAELPAAIAYDRKAREFFGEFTQPNFKYS